MGIEKWGDWARKWAPLIGLPLAIITVILRAIQVFGFSWTVTGYVTIAILSFIFGIVVHYWIQLRETETMPKPKTESIPAPAPPPVKSEPKPKTESYFHRPYRGTYLFDGFNWPYEVEVPKDKTKEPKVKDVEAPICPKCKLEADEKQWLDRSKNWHTTFSCPNVSVKVAKCSVKESRQMKPSGYYDLVRKYIDADIRKGNIDPYRIPIKATNITIAER